MKPQAVRTFCAEPAREDEPESVKDLARKIILPKSLEWLDPDWRVVGLKELKRDASRLNLHRARVLVYWVRTPSNA